MSDIVDQVVAQVLHGTETQPALAPTTEPAQPPETQASEQPTPEAFTLPPGVAELEIPAYREDGTLHSKYKVAELPNLLVAKDKYAADLAAENQRIQQERDRFADILDRVTRNGTATGVQPAQPPVNELAMAEEQWFQQGLRDYPGSSPEEVRSWAKEQVRLDIRIEQRASKIAEQKFQEQTLRTFVSQYNDIRAKDPEFDVMVPNTPAYEIYSAYPGLSPKEHYDKWLVRVGKAPANGATPKPAPAPLPPEAQRVLAAGGNNLMRQPGVSSAPQFQPKEDPRVEDAVQRFNRLFLQGNGTKEQLDSCRKQTRKSMGLE